MLLQRWFSAFGEISIAATHTYTHSLTLAVSAHTAGKLTVVRERFRVPTWAPYNRKTFTIRGGMMNEIWVQLQVMMMMATRSFAKTKFEPCSTSTNFNQFQPTS
jgi:hypothetical protein